MGRTSPPISWLLGTREALPPTVLAKFPELAEIRLRRGGLPPRIGGWFLGRASVAGITLGRSVWLAPGVPASEELLLHEYRHVLQFQASATFPFRYVWESLRRGYWSNTFEVDARRYVALRLHPNHVGLQDKERTIG